MAITQDNQETLWNYSHLVKPVLWRADSPCGLIAGFIYFAAGTFSSLLGAQVFGAAWVLTGVRESQREWWGGVSLVALQII